MRVVGDALVPMLGVWLHAECIDSWGSVVDQCSTPTCLQLPLPQQWGQVLLGTQRFV